MPKSPKNLTMPDAFFSTLQSNAKDVHGLKVDGRQKEKWVGVSAAVLLFLSMPVEVQRRFIREIKGASDRDFATLMKEAASGELLRRIMRDRLNAGELVSADEMAAVHEQSGTGSSSQGSNPTSTANPAEAHGEGKQGGRRHAARAAHK